MPTSMLDRARVRTPVTAHDGRSGATLERVELDDGTHLIVKTTSPRVDLVMRLSGDVDGRERELFDSGLLDELPAGVFHCIVDSWREDDAIVTVMRDLGRGVIGWRRPLRRAAATRVIQAAAKLHGHFVGRDVPALFGLEGRLGFFRPNAMEPEAAGGFVLARAVMRGWEAFADIAPRDVAEGVFAAFDDIAPLATALRKSAPMTMIHGDMWLVNLALEGDDVVLLDWGLATSAPAVVEFASFLAGNASRLEVTREELVAAFRVAEGALVSDESMRLGYLVGLLELGWNKALDAVFHPDAATREREREDLEWWIKAARPALAEL